MVDDRTGETVAVAPHTGAWIETRNARAAHDFLQVAPHTGAWIETATR